MEKRSTVAVVRCASYDPDEVRAAVHRGLDPLGGIGRFVAAGETIVLKPNLLVGRSPDRSVNTHPAVFRAVAEEALTCGAMVRYGDSPGVGRPKDAAARAGIAAAADAVGVPLADFSRGEQVSFPDGDLVKHFTLAAGVVEADGLISLPKLKTHGLTRMTGAVKNQFGCIPGALKAEFHARLSNADLFSRMLVDLNRCIRPRLFVMDAVVAMEGNGPQGGKPRAMNALIVSDDPVAIDAVACRMIALDRTLVLTIAHGERMSLGMPDPKLVGDAVEAFVTPDFDVNRNPLSTTDRPGRPSRVARRIIVPRPRVLAEACTRCGTCVAVCPVSPKAITFEDSSRHQPPRHDYGLCVRCYCCQEMCPENAIDIVTPILGRLIHRHESR